MKTFQTQPCRGSTVLLAEDQPLVRLLAARMLRSMGFNVLEASDGVFALAAATKHDGPLALLVADVAMPRVNGRQLAKRLTARQPGLPVLLLTCADHGLEGCLLEPLAAAAGEPFQLVELESAVETSLMASAA